MIIMIIMVIVVIIIIIVIMNQHEEIIKRNVYAELRNKFYILDELIIILHLVSASEVEF